MKDRYYDEDQIEVGSGYKSYSKDHILEGLNGRCPGRASRIPIIAFISDGEG